MFLARALLWAELWDEALEVASRAVRIRESTGGPDNPLVASSLEIQGEILQRKGLHARARPTLERAVALREASPSLAAELAAALSLLGEQLWFDGDIVQARDYCSRALALAEASLRAGHPDLAVHLRRLALPVDDSGRCAAGAVASCTRALHSPGGPGASPPGCRAPNLNDLGSSWDREGDFSAARSILDQALTAYSARG